MGRYYSGDIEGKFWFGVQASDDADYFGVEGEDGDDGVSLLYFFDKENLPDIVEGINKCNLALGDEKKNIDRFFADNIGYNNEILAVYLAKSKEEVKELLKQYARLELGENILECVLKNGKCEFEAAC